MFVSQSCLSEVDIALSQVNTLLSEVNIKLSVCPVEVRKLILPRIQCILSEVEWTVSMSSDEDSDGDGSSYCADVESLSWDSSGDIYRLYYDEEAEDEDIEERSFEIDDHGPIDFSEDSSGKKEAVPHEDEETKSEDFNFNVNRNVVRVVRKVSASPGWIAPKVGPVIETDSTDEESDYKCKTVPDATATNEDAGVRFVDEMLSKIISLAPNGIYRVTRFRKPLKYTIDLTKVNQFFLRNIPKPEFLPILGCSEDPDFYSDEWIKLDSVDYWGNRNKLPPRHKQQAPFGSLYGFKTDVGIVPVPEEPIHGHVWKEGAWVLQAQVDDGVPAGGPWSPPARTRGGRPSG